MTFHGQARTKQKITKYCDRKLSGFHKVINCLGQFFLKMDLTPLGMKLSYGRERKPENFTKTPVV